MPVTGNSAATERPDWVRRLPEALPPARAYAVAFSGGRDSSVLLHALAGQIRPLRALHVVHGLQPQAEDWGRHCRRQAAALKLDCEILRLEARPPSANLEAWAREQRYAALARALGPEECLLSAHHAGDQAETLLLNLLRGSGPRGLGGMPARRRLPGGQWLLRPLLEVLPEALAAYAEAQQLDWIEDPSNADRRFDRNFLRQDILPRLVARKPGAIAALARSARLVAELAGEQAPDADLARLADGSRIAVQGLAALTPERRNQVLFAWLRGLSLPPPRHRMLEEIWRQMLAARGEARPRIAWPGTELRRQGAFIEARRTASRGPA